MIIATEGWRVREAVRRAIAAGALLSLQAIDGSTRNAIRRSVAQAECLARGFIPMPQAGNLPAIAGRGSRRV
jgi:hypothetical protein